MQGTINAAALEQARSKWGALVRAGVINGVEFAIHVPHGKPPAANLHRATPAGSEARDIRDRYELGHGVPPVFSFSPEAGGGAFFFHGMSGNLVGSFMG